MDHEEWLRAIRAALRGLVGEPDDERRGRLAELLRETPESVAELGDDALRRARRHGGWEAVSLHDDAASNMSVFALPAGLEMPLHDHPGMTVLCVVLRGRAVVHSLDWAEDYPWSGLARSHGEQHVSVDGRCLMLDSGSHNIHGIRAIEDFVFVDLLAPRYDEAGGRACHYYHELGRLEMNGEVFVRLRPVS